MNELFLNLQNKNIYCQSSLVLVEDDQHADNFCRSAAKGKEEHNKHQPAPIV